MLNFMSCSFMLLPYKDLLTCWTISPLFGSKASPLKICGACTFNRSSIILFFFSIISVFCLNESGWEVEWAEGERDVCRAPLNLLFESLPRTVYRFRQCYCSVLCLDASVLYSSNRCRTASVVFFPLCYSNNWACLILLFRHVCFHLF